MMLTAIDVMGLKLFMEGEGGEGGKDLPLSFSARQTVVSPEHAFSRFLRLFKK